MTREIDYSRYLCFGWIRGKPHSLLFNVSTIRERAPSSLVRSRSCWGHHIEYDGHCGMTNPNNWYWIWTKKHGDGIGKIGII